MLLLNTDAFVGPETLTRTLAYMDANPLCGVLGVKLIGRDGMLQPSCRFFPEPLNMFVARAGFTRLFKGLKMVDDMNWDHSTVRPCDWVPGCYYLTRREVLERVGLFDPRYFMYFEEVDHCRRVKDAGWEVVFYPHTSAIHIGGESAKSQGEITRVGRQLETLQIESEVLYIRKHYGYVGLCMHVVLVLLGEAILGIKAVIRARKDQTVSLRVKKMSLFLAIAFRTRFGSQPTR